MGIKALDDYPDLDFIGGYTIEKLESDMISWYKERMKELNGGKDVSIGAASTEMIILKSCAYYIFHGMKIAETNAKMGTLKYSVGEYLDAIGAFKKVERSEATPSTTTIRYSISAARSNATGISAGSRVTAGDGVYFSTNEYAEIPAGSLYVDVKATCGKPGVDGNLYGVGEINKMVDVVPFIDSVKNTTAPANGTDDEDEETFRNDIYLAPDGYSSAGSVGAYKYWVNKYSSDIIDIKIVSPSPRIINIYCLLDGGVIPNAEFVSGLTAYINSDDISMMTDVVSVVNPTAVSYNIDIKYYINASDRGSAETIQQKVTKAVNDFVLWQKSKIGRDLNQAELIYRVMSAGAKRVTVTSPSFVVVGDLQVAVANTINIVYGGLEND